MPTKLVIEAGRAERHYWRDLWRYRELFYFLAWRDILVRYKQTAIGVAWALLRPLLTMAVFTVVFGRIAGLPSGGVPYPILVFAGLLPWQFFSNALTESGNSLVNNANLISKIYFPRLIVPAGSVVAGFVDFAVSFAILGVLMAWYGRVPGPAFLLLPVFVVIAACCSLGAGLWLAALNVEYRDFRFVVPFIVQFGLYVSPVGFSSSIVPERWRLLYSLNPMAGVIDGFRWCIVGDPSDPALASALAAVPGLGSLALPSETFFDWTGQVLGLAVTALLLAGGVWYFRRTERTFADVI